MLAVSLQPKTITRLKVANSILFLRIQGTTLSPIPSSLQMLTIWLQVTTLPLQVPHLYKVPLQNKPSSNYPVSSVPTVPVWDPV